jgi:hypothetical protein
VQHAHHQPGDAGGRAIALEGRRQVEQEARLAGPPLVLTE